MAVIIFYALFDYVIASRALQYKIATSTNVKYYNILVLTETKGSDSRNSIVININVLIIERIRL